MKRIVSLFKKAVPEKKNAIPSLNEYQQAPNRRTKWSVSQLERSKAMSGPRFRQMDFSGQVPQFLITKYQPNPPAAIELIANQHIIRVDKNIATCDGGGSSLGHPKVYINLDLGVNVCGYCGLRFEQNHHH